jgi:hypothetical protein
MADDEKQEDKQPEQAEKTDKAPEQGSLAGDGYKSEDILEGAEPWEPIETKIVLGSFGAAIILLVIFAILINEFVLN